jgi:cell division protein FtsB
MRRGRKRKLFSEMRFVLIFLIVLLVLLVFSLSREIVNRQQVSEKIRNMKSTITGLEQENGEIEDYITRWKDGNQIEKAARVKLGLKKPGEHVVIITRPSGDESTFTIDNNDEIIGHLIKVNNQEEPKSNFAAWWQYFFKK